MHATSQVHSLGIPFPVRPILGIDVRVSSRREAVDFLLEQMRKGQKTLVAFANTNLLKSARARGNAGELSRSFAIFNDGVGLDLASRILYGAPFPENLNGTDFTPALLRAAPESTRVFLYGSKPEVAERAATILSAEYGISVCGYRDGYASAGEDDAIVAAINNACPDVLLVALGNPHQEEWILRNSERLDARLIIGVGAFFDFTAGAVPRAPQWVRAIRMEWSYRLLNEPRRLWRRYSLDLVSLGLALLRTRFSAEAGVPASS